MENAVITLVNVIIIFIVAMYLSATMRLDAGQLDAANLARLRPAATQRVESALPDVAGLSDGLAWLAER